MVSCPNNVCCGIFFPQYRIHFEITFAFSCHCTLLSFNLEQFLRLTLSWYWYFWRLQNELFYRFFPPQFGFIWCFLMSRFRLVVLACLLHKWYLPLIGDISLITVQDVVWFLHWVVTVFPLKLINTHGETLWYHTGMLFCITPFLLDLASVDDSYLNQSLQDCYFSTLPLHFSWHCTLRKSLAFLDIYLFHWFITNMSSWISYFT